MGTVGSRVLDSLKMDRGDLIVGALGERRRAESATIMIDSAKVAFIHRALDEGSNTNYKT